MLYKFNWKRTNNSKFQQHM